MIRKKGQLATIGGSEKIRILSAMRYLYPISLIFPLFRFIIDWLVNKSCFISECKIRFKKILEMVATINNKVLVPYNMHFITFLFAVCNEKLALQNKRSDK